MKSFRKPDYKELKYKLKFSDSIATVLELSMRKSPFKNNFSKNTNLNSYVNSNINYEKG